MNRTPVAIDTSRTSELSLLLSRSEDDFYGILQRAHNDVIQPSVVVEQEELRIYSFQPVEQSLTWFGIARLATSFF